MVVITDRNALLPLEQPVSYSLDRNGRSVTRTWIGPVVTVQAIAGLEELFADRVEFRAEGAIATFRATYGFELGKTEIPIETQELDTESVQQSIFINDTFKKLPSDVVDAVRRQYELKPTVKTNSSSTPYQDALSKIAETTAMTDPTGALGHQALAKRAFDLLQRGSENFEEHTWSLTRTRTVSRRFSGTKIAITDLNKIFTTAELADLVRNPLLFDIPDLTITADDTALNLFGGWRKKQAKVTDSADGKRQMIEQWSLAKWSLDLYVKKTP